MTDMEILGAAIAYTNKCIAGAGGLKGANCTIKSIDPITGGNRITFEWEDNEGHTETSTMDVMDGADGQDGVSPTISVSTITGGHAVSITDAQGTNTFSVMDGIDGSDGKDGKDGTNGTNGTDGVGITSITFKGTDASGNNVYTVNLSNNTSYDITCPKGPAGATGSTGPAGPGVASGGTIGQILKKKSGTDYDTEWVDESDGGGHTIVNGAGTSMTQRDALQFTGGLSVSDDSTNGKTVVSGDYELITWEDWQTIVANHEENLHPDAIITGVPDADGDISVELMTKLWENANPSASFAAQNVSISRDGYDFILTLFSDSEAVILGNIVGDTGQTIINARPSNVYTSYQRRVTVGSTGLSFGDAYELTTSATTTNNAKAIPIVIYGIKTTASVKVSAIAESVSTSADKCMLNDGDSVEERLNKHSYNGQYVDIVNYTVNNPYIVPTDGYARVTNCSVRIGDNSANIDLCTANETAGDTIAVFVRKGTKLYITGSSSTKQAIFIHLA